MSSQFLLTHFDRLAEAPGGIAKLRALILQFAAQGKFIEQNPKDESAEITLKRSNKNALLLKGETSFPAPLGWEWVWENFRSTRSPSPSTKI